jgi:dUTP pyrophosphatase
MMRIYVKSLGGKIPTRNNPTDVGMDIYSNQDIFIPVGETAKIPTGIAIEVKDYLVAKVEDRSSMAAKGLRTGGGVIDPGYTGEVIVVMHNVTSRVDSFVGGGVKLRGYQVRKGDKIAQIVMYNVEIPSIIETENLFWGNGRDNKGFGSSGK